MTMANQSLTNTETIQEFFVETDAQGKIINIDIDGLLLLGYSSKDFAAGIDTINLFAKEDRPRAMKNFSRILNGENLGLNRYSLLSKSGQTRSVLMSSRRREIDQGGLQTTIFVLPPDSRIADLIWEHQQVFSAIMEAIPSGLFMVDAQGRISHWNPAAERLTGLNRVQVIGKSCEELFHCPGFKSCPLSPLQTAGLTTTSCVEVMMRVNGRPVTLQKCANYIHDTDGRITGAIESLMDLTPQAEAEEALREAREIVETTRKSKRNFMANMNHEIRTPLNGIIGLLDLLLVEDPTPSQRENITDARHSANLLMDILDDILDFTIVDKGDVNIEYSEFSLNRVISSVVADQCELTQNKGVCIHSHVDDDVPDSLIGDAKRLYQILKQLVGNAIKFTPFGEAAIRVARVARAFSSYRSVSGDEHKIMLQFSIVDTGVGIPEEKMSTIFEDMSQADDSSTRSFGGVGIGLNLAHRLVQLMGGRIWVDSQVGHGTNVHFTLPFGKTVSPEMEIIRLVEEKTDSIACAGMGTVDKVQCLFVGPKDQALSLAPTPLPDHWQERFRRVKSLMDSQRDVAETMLTDLKADAKKANQNTLETLIFRLLLALRRRDRDSIGHYYTIIENKLASGEGADAALTVEGGKHEDIDR